MLTQDPNQVDGRRRAPGCLCRPCGQSDLAELAARYGTDTSVLDWHRSTPATVMASALGNDPDAQVLKVRRLAAGGRW